MKELPQSTRARIGVEPDADEEALRDEHARRCAAIKPRLRCCESATKLLAVEFIAGRDGVSPDSGAWYANQGVGAEPTYKAYRLFTPTACFCTYCGVAVPKMAFDSSKTVAWWIDGYCKTCGDRCDNCLCDPTESAYSSE